MASAFWESTDLANNEAVHRDKDDNYIYVVLNSVLLYVVNCINNSAGTDIK